MNEHDERLLSQYLDGELPHEAARTVAKRLETDLEIANHLRLLKQLDALSAETFAAHDYAVRPVVRRRVSPIAAAAAILVLAGAGFAAVRAVMIARPNEKEGAASARYPGNDPSQSIEFSAATHSKSLAREAMLADESATSGAPATRITGVVRNFNHEPIFGAVVTAPGTQATRSTDDSGRFELSIPAWKDTATIVVRRSGYFDAQVDLDELLATSSIALDIQLLRQGSAKGRVVNEKGEPVEGVRIAQRTGNSSGPGELLATSDAEGWYSFTGSGLFLGERAFLTTDQLRFDHTDYARALDYAGSPDCPSTTILTEPSAIEVLITRSGAPVKDAAIGVSSSLYSRQDLPSGRTDSDGRMLLASLPSGQTYTVMAMGPEQLMASTGTSPVLAVADVTSKVHLELPQAWPAHVSGHVLGPEGPVAGVLIHAQDDELPGGTRQVLTRPDGSFDLNVGLGRTKVYVSPPRSFEACAVQVVDVARPGEERTIDFQLQVVRRHWVRFVDASGAPFDRVKLDGLGVRAPGGGVTIELQSGEIEVNANPGESFIAANLEQSLGFRGYFHEGNLFDFRGSDTGILPERGTDGREIVTIPLTEPLAFCRGVVRSAEGEALEGARIRLEGRYATESDRAGRFELGPFFPTGTFWLLVDRTGYEPKMLWEVSPAEMSTLEFVLHRLDKSISGRVVAEDGRPIPLANVFLVGPNTNSEHATVTDRNGAFSLAASDLAYTLIAGVGPAVKSESVDVIAPAENVVLVVPLATWPMPSSEVPLGPEHEERTNQMKQLGLTFKMFANESRGEKFPPMTKVPGLFCPDIEKIYPDYMPDPAFVPLIRGEIGAKLCYLGYCITKEETALAFLDAYEEHGPEAIYDQDIEVPNGIGTGGHDKIWRLREGIERFLVEDINSTSPQPSQSDIPILWEVPGDRPEPGGWVLYMDGHVEWQPYPGKFPMTEAFIERVRAITEK